MSNPQITDQAGTLAIGEVECFGDCDIVAKHRAIIHAYDRTRVTIPKGNRYVVVHAHDHAEVEAESGQVFADGWARVFLSGAAGAHACGRSLIIADGRSSVVLVGGAPTIRQASQSARIECGNIDVELRGMK
ncbi:MAG TPA: hypothetical protein VJ777_30225 [Mycobacterium sp.]|nr:hypothetical protein [Mycobacterium sp.]